MFRLTLTRQLALIFAGAMILTQLAVLALDRWYTNSLEQTRRLAVSRSLAANIIKVLPEMPEDLKPLAVRSFSIRGSQFFLLPEPQAGPEAEHLPELAAETMDWVKRRDLPVSEVFAAQYFFAHTGGFIRSVPGTVEDTLPAVFSAGDPLERRMFDVVGEAPLWVPLSPPLGHPPISGRLENAESIDYYPVVTVAFQLEETGQWLTAYSYLRRPGNNDLVTKLYFSVLAMLVIAAIALLMGRQLMRPFRQLARGAEQLGRGEKAEAVVVTGPVDIQSVITAFNRMNTRVTQSIDYQIGLLRSLGHDIKGPLSAASRLLDEVQPESTRAQIEERLDRVRGIVDSIMSFSRAVMRDGEKAPTDLVEMLDTLVAEQLEIGQEATLDAPESLRLACRVEATKRALRNLIENAVKYGNVARVRMRKVDDVAVIRVEDDGPGIPDNLLDDVLEPFRRLDNDDGAGSGLGLSIARTIAVDQGGTLVLSNLATGGLCAEFRLPVGES